MKKLIPQWAAAIVSFALLNLSAVAAERQILHDFVPAAVAKLNLQRVGRLTATNQLHLGISLPLRNNDELAKLLQEIQNPASTNFHRYLTPQQFNERFGPTEADYQAVMSFAKAHGLVVTHTCPGRALLNVDGAVADVEKALHLTLSRYQHPTEARTFFAPDTEPSLDLQVPVLAISGLDNFVEPHSSIRLLPNGEASRNSDGYFVVSPGAILYDGYDFRHAFVPNSNLDGTGQVVGLFAMDGYVTNDIITYEATNGLPNVPVQYVSVNGKSNIPNSFKVPPNQIDEEPPLDIEMAISMAPGLKAVVFYNGSDIDSILMEMADPTEKEPLPLQISSSWEGGTDNATSNCFARLAAQGQSYFYASGDGGAYPVYPSPNGIDNGYDYASGLEPYMTQVGGTELGLNPDGSWQAESVWGSSGSNLEGKPSGSTGGILSTVPIPDFQKPVNMTAVGGSSTQRNVPDVAMPADYILVIATDTNGVQHFNAVGGTSCAAPLWAGFTALVNQQASTEGRPSVGFINPAIYQIAESQMYTNCFHDITNGNNTWSNSPSAYYAAPGYDLCTGWGSPNGVNLINALVSLSGPVFVDFNYTGPASNGNNDGPGSYDYPFKTISQGVNAVSNYGTIFLIDGGSSPETLKISKPMRITAMNGTASIGN
jgi:subtilase family serine protease